ncbi:MAG: ABC transporter, partial [Phormidesmis sp.]
SSTESSNTEPETTGSAEQAAETTELDDLDAEILDAAEADDGSDEADGPKDSRMVVIGNSSFATDGLFDQQLNGDVFLNSVSWLSQIDSPTLSIRPKEATNRRLNMTVQQQILLMLLALVIFPLLGLVGAGTLWARRR